MKENTERRSVISVHFGFGRARLIFFSYRQGIMLVFGESGRSASMILPGLVGYHP